MEFIHPFRNSSEDAMSTSIRHMGDIDVYAADRKPCPICGHPTGDCTGVGSSLPDIKLPKRVIGKEPMFLVEQDVVQERSITPYTKAQVIIHRKGNYISLSEARNLGLVE